MREIAVRKLGVLGSLGVLGVPADEPALFGLFALFVLFASDRTITVPVPGGSADGH
ncbi:hypothetical protein [Halostella litorea]|uniref:hypothetical protein n=1 Tax=Halostella litorea TaxID=2528831 RepID=UPI001386C4F7|nr:hypothetical protein [Halostella litorea]